MTTHRGDFWLFNLNSLTGFIKIVACKFCHRITVESGRPTLESKFHHLLAVKPQAVYSAFLSSSVK